MRMRSSGGLLLPQRPSMSRRAPGLSPDTLARALREQPYYTQGRIPEVATLHDWYAALAYTVRDRLLQRWD